VGRRRRRRAASALDGHARGPADPEEFFHTAGNFRGTRSVQTVDWSHEIALIMFFQNVDAIVGPDEPVITST
jgi:hypothetical protein